MALTGSGQLKFSEIRDEFGGSGQVKSSDLYRGGSLVRANAANNSTTNLAANVPTSGEIQVADFYSQARGFRKTYTSGATNQDASDIFGDDYGVDYPKEIVINSGVELGATSTSQEALQIDSGGAGSINITNNGTSCMTNMQWARWISRNIFHIHLLPLPYVIFAIILLRECNFLQDIMPHIIHQADIDEATPCDLCLCYILKLLNIRYQEICKFTGVLKLLFFNKFKHNHSEVCCYVPMFCILWQFCINICQC